MQNPLIRNDITIFCIIVLFVIVSCLWYFRPSFELSLEGSKYHFYLIIINKSTQDKTKIRLL
jgi:hypothetical protein